jgi:hypothetical protein
LPFAISYGGSGIRDHYGKESNKFLFLRLLIVRPAIILTRPDPKLSMEKWPRKNLLFSRIGLSPGDPKEANYEFSTKKSQSG